MTRFVREFIIGFGFLTGFWINVGFNPESVIVNAILKTIAEFMAPIADALGFMYVILGFAGTVVSFWATYKAGGEWGLLATLFAFAAGLFINTEIGISLLVFALILGLFLPVINKYGY